MILDSERLTGVSRDLLAVMLGFQVESCPAAPPSGGLVLKSRIRILGDSNWLLEVSCPYITASVLAARIFRLPPSELDDDILLDALGEVANIISGNLKGMLDGEYSLTLPSNEIELVREKHLPSDRSVTLSLLCDEMPLHMILSEESLEAMPSVA